MSDVIFNIVLKLFWTIVYPSQNYFNYNTKVSEVNPAGGLSKD